jgi:hypothetical protein
MHRSRWAIRISLDQSRVAAAGAVRALPRLLSAELRLSCP